MERDPLLPLPQCLSFHFNSHAHVERDFTRMVNVEDNKNFNSHAHVERDQIMNFWLFVTGNFNSHAHVERDLLNRVINMFTWISTHTLTWSVTYHGCRNSYSI